MIQVETFEEEQLCDLKLEVNNFCKKHNVIDVHFTACQPFSPIWRGCGDIEKSTYAAIIVYETEK